MIVIKKGFYVSLCVISLQLFLTCDVLADMTSAVSLFKNGDYTLAFNEFKALSEAGDVSAKVMLATMYDNGVGTNVNVDLSFKLYQEAANSGHSMAQANLAAMFYNGTGTEQNYERAFYWFSKAAEAGEEHAIYNLGLLYYKGHGTAKDLEKAFKTIKIAAEANHVDAQNKLGSLYNFAEGTEKNYDEAFKWYKKAAEKGHAEGLYNLGSCYERGEGVSKDLSEAIRLYRAAAKQDYTKAQFNLGVLYASGQGAEKDNKEAVKWYRMAVDKAYPSALYAMGYMYVNGFGVPQDDIEALMHWEISYSLGYEQAAPNIETLSGKLPKPKVLEAHKMAKKWLEERNFSGDKVGILYSATNEQPNVSEKEITAEEVFSQIKANAESGFSDAQLGLAKCYLSGLGTGKNRFQAEKWLIITLMNDPKNDEAIEIFKKEFGWDCIRSDSTEDCMSFVNKDSIVKNENKVWYWNYSFFKVKLDDGYRALIFKSYDVIDCFNNTNANKVFRLLDIETLQPLKDKDFTLKDSEMEFKPLELGRKNKFLIDYLCANEASKKVTSLINEEATANMGTGWAIGNGLIVTNYHVVANKKNIVVYSNAGSAYEADIYSSDKMNDIVILKTKKQDKFPQALPLSKSQLNIGSKVFTIGYPHPDMMGLKPKVTDGIISSISGFMDDPRVLQITVPIQSGNSGGPLLNMNGEVVGIVTAKLNASKIYNWTGDLPQNVNYAVKLPYLEVLTNTLNIAKQKNNSLPPLRATLENHVSRIQNSIFMIVAE